MPSPHIVISIHLHDQMTTGRSFLTGFLNLFVILLLHLGCFFISSAAASNSQKRDGGAAPSYNKRRKVSDSKYFPVIRSYLGHVFSFRRPSVKDTDQDSHHQAGDATIHPTDTTSSLPENSAAAVAAIRPNTPENNHGHVVSDAAASLQTTEHPSFASRKDIYPCQACGEILSKPHLLELHQVTRHSLSELSGDETSYNILQIIFKAGWKGKSPPVVQRILKIHNASRTLARFEEYRDMVQSKAARYAAARGGTGALYERCIADGNERLRFYCSTSICSLRKREASSAAAGGGVCGSQYCSACAIVRHGFTGKQAEMDGIATFATSWAAHLSMPEDLEREFAFMRVRRAMVVCRVVAGRISYGAHNHAGDRREQEIADMEVVEENASARWWDSVVPAGGVQRCKIRQIIRGGGDEEEAEQQLVVFNQRAVLPCFLIIYSSAAA